MVIFLLKMGGSFHGKLWMSSPDGNWWSPNSKIAKIPRKNWIFIPGYPRKNSCQTLLPANNYHSILVGNQNYGNGRVCSVGNKYITVVHTVCVYMYVYIQYLCVYSFEIIGLYTLQLCVCSGYVGSNYINTSLLGKLPISQSNLRYPTTTDLSSSFNVIV